GARVKAKFTDTDLAAHCHQSGRPLLRVDNLKSGNIAEFARHQGADLIVVLGQPMLSAELLDVPTLGLLQTVVPDGFDPAIALSQEGAGLTVEYFARGSRSACNLATVSLPPQTYDGLFGITLKRDLIADDLLLQAAKSLEEGDPTRASKEVKEWVQ